MQKKMIPFMNNLAKKMCLRKYDDDVMMRHHNMRERVRQLRMI